MNNAPYPPQRVRVRWPALAVFILVVLLLLGPTFLSPGVTDWVRILAVLGIACIVLWSIEYFLKNVWPTAYRIERDSGHLVRLHRWKRTVEILTPNGWQLIETPRSPD